MFLVLKNTNNLIFIFAFFFFFGQMNWQELDGWLCLKEKGKLRERTWHREGYMKMWFFSIYVSCFHASSQILYGCVWRRVSEWWDNGLNSCTLIASGRETLFSACLLERKSEGKGCLLFLSFTANIFSVARTNNLSPETLSLKLSDSWETVSALCTAFDCLNPNR